MQPVGLLRHIIEHCRENLHDGFFIGIIVVARQAGRGLMTEDAIDGRIDQSFAIFMISHLAIHTLLELFDDLWNC